MKWLFSILTAEYLHGGKAFCTHSNQNSLVVSAPATQQKEEESTNGETPISKLPSEPSHEIQLPKHEN